MSILTPRLQIRALTSEDAPAVHETIFADSEVMQFLPPKMASDSVERTARRVERWVAHLHEHGFTWCAVEDRDSSEFLGMSGLYTVEGMPGDVEVACLLGRAAWGRGIGTETASACIEHGFEEVGAPRIVAFPRADNLASRHMLGKLRFDEIGPVKYLDDDVILYAITRGAYGEPGEALTSNET